MNTLGLVYKKLSLSGIEEEIEVASSNEIYKLVRRHIKPQFNDWKLKSHNRNGEGAAAFNRRLGRFKSDWLNFEILDLELPADFYPTDVQISERQLLQGTEIADASRWRESLEKEIAEGKLYLLVGMTALLEQAQFSLSMFHSGIPSRCWPCQFRIFEFVVTNAPLCQFIRYRPHVIV